MASIWQRAVTWWRCRRERRRHAAEVATGYRRAREAHLASRMEEAVSAYASVRALVRDVPPTPWRHALAVHHLEALLAAGRLEEAVGLADAELGAWPEAPDVSYLIGEILLAVGMRWPGRAEELLPLVDRAWRRALVIGDRPELLGSVPGRGSWLAAERLAHLHEALGDADHADSFRHLAKVLREHASSAA